ncbi:hypothetical protein HCTV-8_gp63 [Haloarcula virus HCTV-8]|jgi:uncharacterized FAD-dependent dehydrogenase|uniref:Uncharacterized protein n=5 Tax=Haloferacalesvirus TaxID=2843389 RepID=A0AAE8XUH1_9CAUD|nr:hypothetical protein M194_gp060 [Halorubrum tailed phage 5]UBF20390.1 hypothetical protein HCTV-7_gp65 [Haloarcula phage HCTV-7]UBF20506.1 hypothetical protein HCTV-9_gp65 [Haloarcula phage HCTV-9]UBF20622.1 hypothetical protein HCTV-11_gp65 [Haloarcula phage HCTV-11]UBF20738.1 hypothetical protein HRTV-9_gp65 [Halorubrum virus HRTV-9]UBF20851.1 hypothetical protein HRTV-16_gp65 [Halorubrum virus HRTV-16]UBF20962.1 hypothetical protein HCTV-8_gp63 [Haloarcula virus HCTV-8]UBF21074.1 hypot
MEMTDPTEKTEELKRLMNETTVEIGGEDERLSDLVGDIKKAHQELDAYKSGALKLSNALDERILMAKGDEDEQLIEILEGLKDSAFGVYLRLQRGDLELLGERDGKHSGYFAPDDE